MIMGGAMVVDVRVEVEGRGKGNGRGGGGVGGCGWEVSIEHGQCVARSVQSSNVQIVSPASSQTSLKYLEAASSCSPQFLEM